mmetsp:Transcript_70674/g.188647  ORF Transcript_70674/g.188647 Transcript_70674/m.188647 type:complete len:194 (+) Transcript_70674:271-852(+)
MTLSARRGSFLSDSYQRELSPTKLIFVLPLAAWIECMVIAIFLVVEVTGSAGGTNSLAVTRCSLLLALHALMAALAHVLRASAAAGRPNKPVLAWGMAFATLQAACMGSALSSGGQPDMLDSPGRCGKAAVEMVAYWVLGAPAVRRVLHFATKYYIILYDIILCDVLNRKHPQGERPVVGGQPIFFFNLSIII